MEEQICTQGRQPCEDLGRDGIDEEVGAGREGTERVIEEVVARRCGEGDAADRPSVQREPPIDPEGIEAGIEAALDELRPRSEHSGVGKKLRDSAEEPCIRAINEHRTHRMADA
jgi:hypothetical protein